MCENDESDWYPPNVDTSIDPLAGMVTLGGGLLIEIPLGLALIAGVIRGPWYYLGWFVFFIILICILAVLADAG